jgi:glycosyltransferase involved in cell wall biosynthesis
LKILICNKFYFNFGGTDVYLAQLEEMLTGKGHQVGIFSTNHPSNRPSNYQQFFVPYVDFKDPSLGLFSKIKLSKRLIYNGKARKPLGRLIKQFRPDVAHVRNIYHHISPSAFWELKSQGIPVVYHINDFKSICPNYNLVSHGRVCERCKVGKYWHAFTEQCHSTSLGSNLTLCAEAYIHKWLRTYEKCVDRFIAPSEFSRNKLIEYGFDENKIDVLAHFQALLPEADAASLYDYILCFGRLSSEKGVEDLLMAMKKLPRINLVVAGDGPERQKLESWSAAQGLNNVRFTGRLDGRDLQEMIRGARFTVMPSLVYETLGKVILESYALGRPVVASNLGTRPEFVKHGSTGLLYEPYNIDDLTEKISSLYSQPELCRQMGQKGRELLAEKHSPEEYYEKLMGIYERVGGSVNHG